MKYKYKTSGVQFPATCLFCGSVENSLLYGSGFFHESKNYLAICEDCINKFEEIEADWALGLESTIGNNYEN